jgi:hypothetical protein
MLREILWTIHSKLGHYFLLLGGAGLSGRQGLFKDWWRLRGDRCPLMNLLSEEVGLECQENLGALNLAQVEYQSGHLFRCCAGSIGETMQEIAESSRLVDNAFENFFLFRLEGQSCDFRVPILEILQLGASSIAGNLLSPIADWASVLVKLLNFAARNLQTFAMIPAHCQ